MTRSEHTVYLARVLQAEKISQQLHALLTLIAAGKDAGDPVTVTSAANSLACGYNAIIHYIREPGSISERSNRGAAGKHAHLFILDKSRGITTLSLSPHGEHLLQRITLLVIRASGQRVVLPPEPPAAKKAKADHECQLLLGFLFPTRA